MLADRDVERISKVPGLGEISASTVIADPRRFQDEKKLNSWSGPAP